MSNIVKPNALLACNPAAAGAPVRQYLWYVAFTALASAAQRVAVAAQIAAGVVPTGYLAASPNPTLQQADGTWPFPQGVWAFVVAESTTGGFVLGTDTVSKQAGDGW